MKTVIITGASSGIGKATALLLQKDFKLIVCGRRKEALQALVNSFDCPENAHILVFDVSKREEVFNAINSIPDAFKNIDILINNAGNAHGLAHFQDAEIEDLEAMIHSNIMGVIYVTKAVFPLLENQKDAMVINVSSVAGKQVYTYGTTYCASKFGVEAMTKGMRLDFLHAGIRVGSVSPGAVATDFSMVRFKGDSERAEKVYMGYEPLLADDVAQAIAFMINQPPHVQIGDIEIMPKAQANAATILKK